MIASLDFFKNEVPSFQLTVFWSQAKATHAVVEHLDKFLFFGESQKILQQTINTCETFHIWVAPGFLVELCLTFIKCDRKFLEGLRWTGTTSSGKCVAE